MQTDSPSENVRAHILQDVLARADGDLEIRIHLEMLTGVQKRVTDK